MVLKKYWLIIGLFLCQTLLPIVSVNAQPLTVGVIGPYSSDGEDVTTYYEDVIRIALEKTRASHGDFIIKHRPFEASIDRVKAMLKSAAGVDVIWASVTPERKETMRYVKVNLLHDLNNYRALLIRKSDLNKFKRIRTLEGLRAYKAGNGNRWTDTKIMEDNGFVVMTAVDFGLLVKMLNANRFDFLTRGLHEIGVDLSMPASAQLAVVPNLILKYSEPIHYGFFVRKDDEELAQRLEAGLALAEADGSLRVLFDRMRLFDPGRELLAKKPKILKIKNTALQH